MKCVAENPNCVAGLVMMVKHTDAVVCEPCKAHREKVTRETAEAERKQKRQPVVQTV